MAKKYMTEAHTNARTSGFGCVGCERDLKNARYDGEYCFGYDKQGHERWMAVYLTCRCGTINEISMDLTDDVGFMDAKDDVYQVPAAAKKITKAPETEQAGVK